MVHCDILALIESVRWRHNMRAHNPQRPYWSTSEPLAAARFVYAHRTAKLFAL